MKQPEIIEGKFSGNISFDNLEFSEIHTKRVEPADKKNPKSNGRIYLPKEYVGKLVYVLLKQKKRSVKKK